MKYIIQELLFPSTSSETTQENSTWFFSFMTLFMWFKDTGDLSIRVSYSTDSSTTMPFKYFSDDKTDSNKFYQKNVMHKVLCIPGTINADNDIMTLSPCRW